MLAPVYVRCQDLKKAKRHNLLLPVTNLFRKEKQTKQEITIPASKAPKFKAGKALKDSLN
jgi:hypothetical protein